MLRIICGHKQDMCHPSTSACAAYLGATQHCRCSWGLGLSAFANTVRSSPLAFASFTRFALTRKSQTKVNEQGNRSDKQNLQKTTLRAMLLRWGIFLEGHGIKTCHIVSITRSSEKQDLLTLFPRVSTSCCSVSLRERRGDERRPST